MTGQWRGYSSHTALQGAPVLTQLVTWAIPFPQPENDGDSRPQIFFSLLSGCVLTHLLGEAVWPPRGGNEVLQTSLLHAQWALNVEEHDGTEHIKATAKLKQAQKLHWEKVQGMLSEL